MIDLIFKTFVLQNKIATAPPAEPGCGWKGKGMKHKEKKSETPDYSPVLDKIKEMKKAEDYAKVIVMTKLRRLKDGNR